MFQEMFFSHTELDCLENGYNSNSDGKKYEEHILTDLSLNLLVWSTGMTCLWCILTSLLILFFVIILRIAIYKILDHL